MRKKIWQTELKCVCGNLNGGNINFVKSERSIYRKHYYRNIKNRQYSLSEYTYFYISKSITSYTFAAGFSNR